MCNKLYIPPMLHPHALLSSLEHPICSRAAQCRLNKVLCYWDPVQFNWQGYWPFLGCEQQCWQVEMVSIQCSCNSKWWRVVLRWEEELRQGRKTVWEFEWVTWKFSSMFHLPAQIRLHVNLHQWAKFKLACSLPWPPHTLHLLSVSHVVVHGHSTLCCHI